MVYLPPSLIYSCKPVKIELLRGPNKILIPNFKCFNCLSSPSLCILKTYYARGADRFMVDNSCIWLLHVMLTPEYPNLKSFITLSVQHKLLISSEAYFPMKNIPAHSWDVRWNRMNRCWRGVLIQFPRLWKFQSIFNFYIKSWWRSDVPYSVGQIIKV